MGNIAKWAATGTDSAEDHKGRCAVVKTLCQIRARGFLADGVQTVAAQRLFDIQNTLIG
jgi:hypothetical protein